MYSAPMTESIDCFSSTPPPAHGERPPEALEEDYGLVFDSLRISVEAASTVFARAIKFDIIHQFQETGIRVVRETQTEAEPLLPCWVQQTSVTIPVPVFGPGDSNWIVFKESSKLLLRELSFGVVSGVIRTMAVRAGYAGEPCHKVHLIGAANTDIREIRSGVFSFFVKQKWAISRHARP